MADIVFDTLKKDSEYRVPGVIGDLYEIDELSIKEWNHSLPTLHESDGMNLFQNNLKRYDRASFVEKFKKLYPDLAFLSNVDNIIFAGGSMGNIILEKTSEDIDIFIYGKDTVEEAEKKIKEIYDTIYNTLVHNENARRMRDKTTNNLPMHISVHIDTFRTDRYTEFRWYNCKKYKVQVIHRLYSSISEILHGFDLGPSAIGFDYKNANVYFTTLSKFSYEYKCMIIDTSRRSKSYEHRIDKYFKRGFSLILPYLNISLCNDNLWRNYQIPNVLELPYLAFTYKGMGTNSLENVSIRVRVNLDKSDYEEEILENDFYFKILNINLKHIVSKNYNRIIRYSEEYDKNNLLITPARVNHIYSSLSEKILKKSVFPIRLVENYLDYPVEQVFNIRNNPEKLREIINESKQRVIDRISEIPKTPGWITENPGTQLTGSFNPIIEDPVKWYSNYYIKR